MLKSILTSLSGTVTPRKSIDDVLASFNKTVADLKLIAADREGEAKLFINDACAQRAAANISAVKASVATSEAARALAVAKRIEELTV